MNRRTSPSWDVIDLPNFPHTLQPPPPLSIFVSSTKKCWKLEQLTLKRGEGGGGGGGGEVGKVGSSRSSGY